MVTVTADDIRVLARTADASAVLACAGDEIRVVPDGEEAEVLAAGLTAQLGA